ncbi:hypothetical protein Moror_6185 [Moniliophthora roreri MCA 2997]|uniref:F-box domain-containing protein n=2 Tax=Moniliophthora roreri TaxID=221103 RepID=V2WW87_MONRO|nr:hypothetical protein Moror_6185 [Moniliophthora roreri MCA 2997]
MPHSHLPVEVWCCITQYLARDELLNMMGVNRVFFHQAMDERYQEISLFKLDKNTLDLLAHFSSPFITPRLRKLRIHASFIQELLRMDSTSHIAQLEGFLSHVSNLQECHIVWSDLPLFQEPSTPRILRAVSASSNLRKLSLIASLRNLGEMLVPDIRLSLEDLELSIPYEPDVDITSLSAIMANHIVPFIHQTSHTLTTFSFESSHAIDFSPLFKELSTFDFPLLRTLSLSVPAMPPYLGDHHSIRSFLKARLDTLTELRLRGLHIESLDTEGPSRCDRPSSSSSFAVWILACFSEPLPTHNLQTLVILTNFFPPEAVVPCVQRLASPSLTGLEITGRHLSFGQVEEILSTQTFLGKLKLGTVTLSPELMDLLAERLPDLGVLDLVIREAVPSKDITPLYAGKRMKRMKRQDPGQINEFRNQMRKRHYDGWTRLKRVGVWRFASKMRLEDLYVKMLEECVPLLGH